MDASAFIHRAFHALRKFATSSGQLTGAAYGFTGTLIRLLKDKKPHFLAVVYDSKGPTRRHKLFPDYKKKRPPMDPDLISQQEAIRDIVRAMGLFSLEKPGFEADDLIAAMTKSASNLGHPVVIVSGDKDFYQLLAPTVSMYDPDPKKNSAMTETDFRARFNLEPMAFLEIQALMGDSSDNIPGVPTVGEKKAIKLITDFGTIDNLYQNLNKVENTKLRETLSANE
jgi:DNA polymerase-1